MLLNKSRVIQDRTLRTEKKYQGSIFFVWPNQGGWLGSPAVDLKKILEPPIYWPQNDIKWA